MDWTFNKRGDIGIFSCGLLMIRLILGFGAE